MIFSRRLFTEIFILIFLCWAFQEVQAQQTTLSLTTDSKIVVENQVIKTLLLQVANASEEPKEFRIGVEAPPEVTVVNKKSLDTLWQVGAGRQLFIPVNIYIGRKQTTESGEILFQMISREGQSLTTAKTELSIPVKRKLRLQPVNPQISFVHTGDSIQVKIKAINGGNRAEDIVVNARFPRPDGNEIKQEKRIRLNTFSEETLNFGLLADRQFMQMGLFNVEVTGSQPNGSIYDRVSVLVQNASSSKIFFDPLQSLNQSGASQNFVALSAMNSFTQGGTSYNINAHSEVNVLGGRIALNANGNYWPDSKSSTLFSNTYLRYDQERFGIQVGNVSNYESDFNMNGRGLEFSWFDEKRKDPLLKVGVLEKNYNLFANSPLTDSPLGYSLYATSVVPLSSKSRLLSAAIWDEDRFRRASLIQEGYSYQGKNTRFLVKAAFAESTSPRDKELHEPSFAGTLNWEQKWKKLSFSTQNYISTGYFPGIRQGTLISDQRISYDFGKTSLRAGFRIDNYEPRNIDPLAFSSSESKRNKTYLAWSLSKKRFRLQLSPYLAHEETSLYISSQASSSLVKFSNAGMIAQLGYNLPGHLFSLQLTGGTSKYTGRTKNSPVYAIQGSWYHKDLSLNFNYQKGNLLLYEGSFGSETFLQAEKFYSNLSYRKNFLQNRLQATANVYFNYLKRSGTSVSIAPGLIYKTKHGTSATASYNYTRFVNSLFRSNYGYLQLGIRQDLPGTTRGFGGKTGTMEIFLFEDKSDDDLFTPGIDEVLPNIKISVDGALLTANKDGRAIYKRVPRGLHKVKVLDNKWYDDDLEVDLTGKYQFVAIGLERRSPVEGKIQYAPSQENEFPVEKVIAGVPVVFRGSRDRVFTFYTNERGTYRGYLPVGEYSVTVGRGSLQKNVYTEPDAVNIKILPNESLKVPLFLLKVRQKKIELRRFGEL